MTWWTGPDRAEAGRGAGSPHVPSDDVVIEAPRRPDSTAMPPPAPKMAATDPDLDEDQQRGAIDERRRRFGREDRDPIGPPPDWTPPDRERRRRPVRGRGRVVGLGLALLAVWAVDLLRAEGAIEVGALSVTAWFVPGATVLALVAAALPRPLTATLASLAASAVGAVAGWDLVLAVSRFSDDGTGVVQGLLGDERLLLGAVALFCLALAQVAAAGVLATASRFR